MLNHHTKNKKIAIVGAGISGLSLAWFLEKKGFQHIHIFEQKSTIGGILQTHISAQSVVEQAAESVALYPKTITELIEAVGLSNEIIYPKTAKFQIYVKGKLNSPPEGLRFMVPTQVEEFKKNPFFSEQGKQRIFNEINIAPSTSNSEESLKDFVCRRFGDEMYKRYAAPVYGGIFGYAAEQLSIQSVLPQLTQWEAKYGSVTKAVQTLYPISSINQSSNKKKTTNYFSLKNGMHSLVKAITQHLTHSQIFLNHRIDQLSYKNKCWEIDNALYDEVFVTTAAPSASGILATAHPTLSKLLTQIAFKSAAIITFIFKQIDLTLNKNISGILLPVEDFPEFSAITFSSNKWTNRIDKDKVLLRLYLRDTPWLNEAEEDIVSKALQSLQQLVPIKNLPLKHQYHQWFKSRPLYTIGHQKIISDIQKILDELPGLHLTGCSYKGSGVASLVHQAKELTINYD